MRLPSFLFTLLMTIALLCGGVFLFEHFFKGASPKLFGSYEYPAELTLMNQNGQQLEVTLIARNAKFIQFNRKTDNSEFIYEISDLDAASRNVIERYPDVGLVNAGVHLNNTSITLNDVHSNAIREHIDKLNDKISQLNRKIGDGVDMAQRRGIMKEIRLIDEKRTTLLRELERHDLMASQLERSTLEPQMYGEASTATSRTGNGSKGLSIELIQALDSIRSVKQSSDQ